MTDNLRSPPSIFSDPDRGSLLDLLDRILDKGIVVHGELILSVAGIDLVFIGLHVVVASVDRMTRARRELLEEAR
ncbi:Putative gas vesicle synthesis protein, GvpJ-like (GvpA-related) [Bradyrhizobium sp. ORS 278]|uniref:gas vesicle protein GvpJ n=1 Tax=Bradyrhizobium sp. (strain ORS 278) TaxID=114615 RepID=UPI0001507D2B|nr:gas vesicle protein GvpJ [Bradyrhizobium sp. ORS 278]CAL75179.1 Putative gas vesicle synthesis protein, GvpJ-like (GvpA-related) [Bradyrhizobium sp. ORS 278]